MRSGAVLALSGILLVVCCAERAGDSSPPSTSPRAQRSVGRFQWQKGPCVVRVKHGATGVEDGQTWSTAFDAIAEAIAEAKAAVEAQDQVTQCQVWVAQGTYHVFQRSRMDTLQMAENVHLYGGFRGDEDRLDRRDFKAFETIIDGRDSPRDTDRVYHVITGANNAVLDGFTVTHGNAARARHGGAMYNNRVSPAVRNCVFEKNGAGWYGGAIFNNHSFCNISNCVFEGNTAKYGGAVMNQETSGQISNVLFKGNQGTKHGGALYNHSRVSTRIVNSVFYDNQSKGSGGAAYNLYRANPRFVNCTFFKNKARKKKGSAIYSEFKSEPIIVNSILWDNGSVPLYEEMAVSYSIVEHGFEGRANRDEDPLIAMQEDGTYTLEPGSPCIDGAKGSEAPAVDMAGKERIDDVTVEDAFTCEEDAKLCTAHADIGAVEFCPAPGAVEPEAR